MAISPINFVSGFGLVPMFAWVPVDPEPAPNADTPPPPTTGESGTPDAGSVDANGTGSQDPAQLDRDPSTNPKLRLVFIGFQWNSEAGIATFPRPDWMSGLAGESDDPSDPSTKRDDRKHQSDASRALQASIATRQAAPSGQDDPPSSPSGNAGEA